MLLPTLLPRAPAPILSTWNAAPVLQAFTPSGGPVRLHQQGQEFACSRFSSVGARRRWSACTSFATAALRSAVDAEKQYDVIGLGQAMVDLCYAVGDGTLAGLGIDKAERRVISVPERGQIMASLAELQAQHEVSAGGSLANTLVGLSRLGNCWHSRYQLGPLRVGFWSICGSDPQGIFHCAQMRAAGVDVVSPVEPNSHTGTVMVLTTPDAQRSFLSFLGSPRPLEVTPALREALRSTRTLLVEGYMLEMPGAASALLEAIMIAKESGAEVALTAGDAGMVSRHRQLFWKLIGAGVDIFFSNRAEAEALLQQQCTAKEAARLLGPHCTMAVVTDGANGSYVSALGFLRVVPPHWMAFPPVDTCGAGDAYAAGLLFGWITGQGLTSMGRIAARTASAVISRQGAAVSPEQAAEVMEAVVPVGILEAAQQADPAFAAQHQQ